MKKIFEDFFDDYGHIERKSSKEIVLTKEDTELPSPDEYEYIIKYHIIFPKYCPNYEQVAGEKLEMLMEMYATDYKICVLKNGTEIYKKYDKLLRLNSDNLGLSYIICGFNPSKTYPMYVQWFNIFNLADTIVYLYGEDYKRRETSYCASSYIGNAFRTKQVPRKNYQEFAQKIVDELYTFSNLGDEQYDKETIAQYVDKRFNKLRTFLKQKRNNKNIK